jgi:hypothetical protein
VHSERYRLLTTVSPSSILQTRSRRLDKNRGKSLVMFWSGRPFLFDSG